MWCQTLPGGWKNYGNTNNRNTTLTRLNLTMWGDIDGVFPSNCTLWKISRVKYGGTLLSKISIAGWGTRHWRDFSFPFWDHVVLWNTAWFSGKEEGSAQGWGNIWLLDICTGVWCTKVNSLDIFFLPFTDSEEKKLTRPACKNTFTKLFSFFIYIMKKWESIAN